MSQQMAQVLSCPVRWGQVFLANSDGSPRRYWSHQIEDLRCDAANIIHLDGRDVGKTINLTTSALHYAFVTPGGKGLVAAPHQGQLDTIIEEIEGQIERSPVLSNSIAMNRYGKQKITRKPYYRVEFVNGAILYFRPAGAYGVPFRSLHVQRIWADEAAWLPEKAWTALRQCLKTGGKWRIYSTPNGVRDTTYYRLTTKSKVFTVFRWPSWKSPTWTKSREAELLDFYGGRDTVGWQHEVAGEHGRPSYGAFNVEHVANALKDLLEYKRIHITGSELRDCQSENEAEARLDMLLDLSPVSGRFWIGGDLGYTNDPTELMVFREDISEEKSTLRAILRVHMTQVGYPLISQTIGLLAAYFKPAGIGIDYGGNGMAVVQELTHLDKYKHLHFGQLQGYHFGGTTSVVVGTDDNGQPIEAKKRTKEYMTQLISGALQRGELTLPSSDTEIEDQFVTQTYSLQSGVVVYSKGNDHILDAIRCAMLVRDETTAKATDSGDVIYVNLKPVITDPVFEY